MNSRIAMTAVLVLSCLGAGACGSKGDPVKFDAYDTGALTMARNLGKPVVVYATADW
jgi:hypothetical protein